MFNEQQNNRVESRSHGPQPVSLNCISFNVKAFPQGRLTSIRNSEEVLLGFYDHRFFSGTTSADL